MFYELREKLLRALVGGFVICGSPTTVYAAMIPFPAAVDTRSDVQLASGGCGAGHHRTLSGRCAPDVVDRRHCQPGMHAISFPSRSGYRCVPNVR